MKHPVTLLALGAALVLSLPARAADIDWKKVDAALGKTAAVSGEVHRYGLPRSDLHVTLDGISVKPALALGGWVAFAPTHGEAMVMGDLVLLETEITPVMSKLLDSGLDTQETLRGIVANVDEGNDKITVRLPSAGTAGDVTGDFKVQDGLIFNAVRYGDEVEFTVETIMGTRTIVALWKR